MTILAGTTWPALSRRALLRLSVASAVLLLSGRVVAARTDAGSWILGPGDR